MTKKVIVIGAGFSGLSTAAFLANEGFDVTVLEKNEMAGGRARVFKEQGFVFDMGPSWYWMPDVFDSFFSKFGHKAADFYNLVRLDPSYRVFWSEKESWDIPASMQELKALFESKEKGSSAGLDDFLADAKYKYEVGINDLVYKPGLSLLEFMDKRVVMGALKLDLFNSFSTYIRKYFKNPQLLQLLEFPVLFLGAKPEKTPALYSLMNYADMALGTWYPMGGMHEIVKAMVQVAEKQGVKFVYNEEVASMPDANRTIKEVQCKSGNRYTADVVVASADYHHIDKQVLTEHRSNYTEKYWDKRVMAPSCLLYYVGVNKRLNNLKHHNLFFDESFTQHAVEIYDSPQWPSKPLFYVSCPSITDASVAPEGCENIFILIPVAPGLADDTEAIKEKYFNMVMDRLEKISGQEIRSAIVYKRSYAQSNFIQDYNSYKGNAYGLANTLMQTAILKPSIKNMHLDNLFYTGQLTVPGPGVPPSLISGEVVAKVVSKSFLN